jgi:hypothetical protein
MAISTGVPLFHDRARGLLVVLQAPNILEVYRCTPSRSSKRQEDWYVDIDPVSAAPIDHVDDAFTLPMHGLIRLAIEFYRTIGQGESDESI